MIDLKKLVDSILAGNKAAFRDLINQTQRLVSHIVYRMIKRESDQEDICQEVFIKVYQNLGNFRFDCKLSTWIARIAYTTCLNFLEKKKLPFYEDLGDENKSFEPADGETKRPDYQFAQKDISAILRQEIDNIPPVYRTIVTLYHIDEMSYAEIADIMKMPEGTVKSYLFRARRMLKDRLLAKYNREEL
ncbi:MAG: sigma-70 family RNA polymerase sigma factor [candidate division Zixibacteria bacterium]